MSKKFVMIVVAACTLMLTACGKSEEQKAVDEIYNNLDSEGQAAVDQMREEVAAYEESKADEPEQNLSDYQDKMVEWVIGEDILADSWPMYEQVVPSGIKVMFPSKDVVTNNGDVWKYGDVNNGCMLKVTVEECENILEGEESIGNYGFYLYTIEDQSVTYTYIINRITNMAIVVNIYGMNVEISKDIFETNKAFILEQVKALPVVEADELPYGVYQSEDGIKAEVSDDTRGEHMVSITSLDNMTFSYDISYRVDGTFMVSGDTDGTLSYDGNAITITGTGNIDGTYIAQSAPPVRGDVPYGHYVCESGAEADISSFHNETDTIDFLFNGEELMTDFSYIGSNTYTLTMPNEILSLGIAVFDENGNMQVTANAEEVKAFEGYYIMQ